MNCLVCKKEFQGSKCPRCGFPVVESTDVDVLIESMQNQIERYRRSFLSDLAFSLRIYHWKADGERIVPNGSELVPVGSFLELCGNPKPLAQKFARIPNADTIEFEVVITSGERTGTIRASVPNLKDPSLETVSIETDEDMRFRVCLINDFGNTSSSAWLPVDL